LQPLGKISSHKLNEAKKKDSQRRELAGGLKLFGATRSRSGPEGSCPARPGTTNASEGTCEKLKRSPAGGTLPNPKKVVTSVSKRKGKDIKKGEGEKAGQPERAKNYTWNMCLNAYHFVGPNKTWRENIKENKTKGKEGQRRQNGKEGYQGKETGSRPNKNLKHPRFARRGETGKGYQQKTREIKVGQRCRERGSLAGNLKKKT